MFGGEDSGGFGRFFRKTLKKVLTSVIESGILTKLSERATSSVEGPKKLEKSFAKPLDKAAAK